MVDTGGIAGVHYASSKAALHGIVHWVARRYARENIVSVIALELHA
jgi:3-oxoacyl-[acyl-carrier protein] reductase